MKSDEHTFYRIEDYLKGKLSPQEIADFEREIAADPELAETVEMQRLEREGLLYMMGEDLRTKLKQWETSPPDTTVLDSRPLPLHRRWWPRVFGGVAIVFVIVLGIFWKEIVEIINPSIPTIEHPSNESPTEPAHQQQPQQVPIATDTPEKLPTAPKTPKSYDEKLLVFAETNFGTPSTLANNNIRSTNGTGADPLKEWKEQLRQPKPDYKKAIAGLSKIMADEEADALLAYAYFKYKQFGKAAAIYQRLSESQKLTPAQKDEAEWHLLMSLLPDSSNRKKVDSLISKMTNPDNYHEFQREANELKAKLSQ